MVQEERQSEFHLSWLRSLVAESMSVLTYPTTYGILRELTNCPRSAGVLGELAAQWQQVLATI